MRVTPAVLGSVHTAGDARMNATNIEQFDVSYSDRPPVLIGASSEAALTRARRTVEAAGWRIGDTMASKRPASASNHKLSQARSGSSWIVTAALNSTTCLTASTAVLPMDA